MGKWEFHTLADLCDFEKGKTGLAKATPGEYPLVATGADRKSCDLYQFDTKAVCVPLVSSTGHGHKSLNYVHYQEGKFALGTILVAITPKDDQILNPQFLHLYLSELKDILLVPLMRGGANVSLSITNIKTVKVPVPSIQEQHDIVDQFNSMEKDHSTLVNEITHQQELLQKLRQSILLDAVQGKLTEQWRKDNPDVEPASELLKRTKEEKEKLIKEKKIRKTKALPPRTEDEIPFNLPDGWEWVKIDFVANEIFSGFSFKSECFKLDGNNQVLRLGNIRPYFIRFNTKPVFVPDDIANNAQNFKLKHDDLLITMTGTRGKHDYCYTVLLENNHFSVKNLYLNQRVGCFRFSKLVPTKYFDFILKETNLLEQIYKTATGAANQANIGINSLRGWIVPLPPLAEQQAIVTKIHKLYSCCDQLEEQINQSKSNSELLMQTVLKEAFAS